MSARNAPGVGDANSVNGVGKVPATETDSWRTIPNFITALRILLIIPFVHYAMGGRDWEALGVFALAGLSDTLDGTLARWLKQTSRWGRLVDPVADKVLTGIAYLTLSVFRGGEAAIPVWVMGLVIARDVLILVGCWIVYRLAHDTGFTPSIAGKFNTLIELAVIACFLAATRFPSLSAAMPALYLVMAASILVSFAGYARQGVRMIRANAAG